MIIKRIPLFIVGLLYGAVINSAVLGLGYGVYAAGVAIGAILEGCCGRGGGSGCLIGNSDAAAVIGAIVGIIIFAAAVIGFGIGVLYGLLTGSWHCAMDFYNNGFLQGLSSPFRFLSAKWSNDINHDTTELREYYNSTDVNFFEKKQAAQHAIERRAEAIHTTIDEIEKIEKQVFPKRLSQIIARYSISPDDIEVPADMSRTIASVIEESVLPVSEIKPPPRTAASFFTGEETVKIIDKHHFFAESKRISSQVNEISTVSIPNSHYPLIKETLQLIRCSR